MDLDPDAEIRFAVPPDDFDAHSIEQDAHTQSAVHHDINPSPEVCGWMHAMKPASEASEP